MVKIEKKHPLKLKHLIKLTLLYWSVLVICILWVDYYSYEELNPIPFIIIAFFVSIFATYFHVKKHEKTYVDKLTDKI